MTDGAAPSHSSRRRGLELNKQPSEREWGKVAVAAGLAATVFYFFSIVFKPLPVPISRILFFAIGPASVISAVGFFQALRTSARVIPLALGTVLGIVAGAVLTLMAVVQATQFTVLPRRIANAPTEAVQETLTRILLGSQRCPVRPRYFLGHLRRAQYHLPGARTAASPSVWAHLALAGRAGSRVGTHAESLHLPDRAFLRRPGGPRPSSRSVVHDRAHPIVAIVAMARYRGRGHLFR